MIKGFKRFEKNVRATEPFCGIRKNGQISFNAGAVAKYDLDVYEWVVLFIGDDHARFAVKFTNDKKEEGRREIQRRPGNFAISAIPFLKLYDIPFKKTINFPFKWIECEKTAIVEFRERKFIKTENDTIKQILKQGDINKDENNLLSISKAKMKPVQASEM